MKHTLHKSRPGSRCAEITKQTQFRVNSILFKSLRRPTARFPSPADHPFRQRDVSPTPWPTPLADVSSATVSNLRLQVDGPQGGPSRSDPGAPTGASDCGPHPGHRYNEALRQRVGELLHDLEQHGFRSEDVAQPVKETADTQLSGAAIAATRATEAHRRTSGRLRDSEQRQQRLDQQQEERASHGAAWQGLFASAVAGMDSTTGKE